VWKLSAHLLGVAATAVIGSSACAQEDFPIVGTYTENQVCKGDGSGSSIPRVKITARNIESTFGLCTILDSKRNGNTFAVHVECTGAGGSALLGDVTFTLRDDKTIDFSDQDQTYKAVLHKCPS
jgi:hypothetical protein